MSKDGAKAVAAIVLAVVLGGGALAYGGFELHKLREIERGPAVEGHAIGWSKSTSRGRVTGRAGGRIGKVSRA